MTKIRFVLRTSLLASLALVAGCNSLKGCMKPPLDAETQEKPLLRTPVGLDPPDNSAVMKVPPPIDASAVRPAPSGCLEEPPLIEALPDPGLSAKQIKKAARKERAAARKKEAEAKAAEKAAKKSEGKSP